MSCVHSDGRGQCQQNNAPPHKSTVANEWFEKHPPEFRSIPWPSNSPDLDIIKHIWHVLQRAVLKTYPSPCSPMGLWTTLQEPWCELSAEYLHN
ncbi:unnamed protein product [Larinioides sclopetarius]|uniref:Tc1-like transposase DDE domain-containing protein n=1 Tax=Larinioides sclopetarius TaxID=280406 RepID=A0AAV1Z0H4_9ARAC